MEIYRLTNNNVTRVQMMQNDQEVPKLNKSINTLWFYNKSSLYMVKLSQILALHLLELYQWRSPLEKSSLEL